MTRSIEGRREHAAGFAGFASRGPTEPTLVTNYTQYRQQFGTSGPLARAVKGFFENGGLRLFVARALGEDDAEAVTAIASLDAVEDVRILAAPGRTSPTVQAALIAQAELRRDRFVVLDGEPNPADLAAILAHRAPFDSSYAAYYTPWLQVTERGRKVAVPPSGHVAGVYVRSDIEHGVFKPPVNQVVHGITGLTRNLTASDQEVLNPVGSNCIRNMAGRGLRVWGGRTVSRDPDWKYVSTRRCVIYLEKSIYIGTQWAVFEPNAEPTWAAIRASIEEFLVTEWRGGALAGAKPEEAFFVRCDPSTMTAEDIAEGRLVCLIGVAMLRPAEFVIFRVGQSLAG
jgi:uncharacterized protein